MNLTEANDNDRILTDYIQVRINKAMKEKNIDMADLIW